MSWVILVPDVNDSRIAWPFLDFDLTLSETHEIEATITDHPVEEGTNISDNSRAGPRAFSCEVFVTNTPIDPGNGNRYGVGSPSPVSVPFPSYTPPFSPTPGGINNAIGNAIKDLISGNPPLNFSVLTFPTVFDAIVDTQSKLLELVEKGVSTTFYTSTLTYIGMLLTSVSMPRTEKGGASFAITARQVRTVQTANVAAPKPATPRGAPNQAKGSQSTKPGDPEPPASSLAANFLKSVGVIQ